MWWTREVSIQMTEEFEDSDFDETSVEVVGNLESRSAYKVILHFDVSSSEDDSCLKTGDTIWLNFSERNYYIEAKISGEVVENTLEWVLNNIKNRTGVHKSTEEDFDFSVGQDLLEYVRDTGQTTIS